MPWTPVEREEAEKDRYYGFGGWLLALYIAILLYLLAWLPVFFLETPASWERDYFLAWIVARAVLWLPFLILAPLEHPLMPPLTIAAMWIALPVTWTIGAMGSHSHPITWIPEMVIGVGFAALATWYFRSSRRVNATYRCRVWT